MTSRAPVEVALSSSTLSLMSLDPCGVCSYGSCISIEPKLHEGKALSVCGRAAEYTGVEIGRFRFHSPPVAWCPKQRGFARGDIRASCLWALCELLAASVFVSDCRGSSSAKWAPARRGRGACHRGVTCGLGDEQMSRLEVDIQSARVAQLELVFRSSQNAEVPLR